MQNSIRSLAHPLLSPSAFKFGLPGYNHWYRVLYVTISIEAWPSVGRFLSMVEAQIDYSCKFFLTLLRHLGHHNCLVHLLGSKLALKL